MAAAQSGRHYRFGPFEADLRAGELRKNGATVHLPEQPFQILCALIENQGELVTREEIRLKLWPGGTIVEFDHSINAAVRRLRDLLGDDAEHPVYIETIPHRGYRFIADVHRGAASAHAASGLFAGSPAGDQEEAEAIAVLPFENVSGDPDSEYLSDGITETLINSLSQLGRLKVLARRTVFRYKGRTADAAGLGRKLNVRAVLTGRVLQRGDTLMICAELIDAVNGWQLWGERYKRSPGDIFDVQEEIARVIFEKLRVKLGQEEEQQLARRHTRNTRAYEAYLKGLFFWNKWSVDGFCKAEEFFRLAIEEDPAYAPAYAGLADSLSAPRYLGLVSPRETIP
ncbi:MAG: winged helix-turn-helix domain-containing protein, partial [Acidobacteriota bacterium]|nr:winged helix-turn-helix domain-containing protein [Acidobacteriota bacterium]